MAAEKSYTRLGLFVVLTMVIGVAGLLFFLQRSRERASIPVVTYITENVSGLDVSSSVRFRGVPVGRVTDIRVDPSTDAVEVNFEVYEDRLTSLGADVELTRQKAAAGFPRMRTRVVGNPVTGDAYLLLDVPVDPPPPPPLGFTPARAYIASMASPLATASSRLPEVLEQAESALRVLATIAARIPDSLDRSDRFFTSVEQILTASHLPELSADLRSFAGAQTADVAAIRADLVRLMGPEGSMIKFVDEARGAIRDADVPALVRTVQGSAERSTLAADDLRVSLSAARDTLQQLRELARLLEDQPESVVYGRRAVPRRQ